MVKKLKPGSKGLPGKDFVVEVRIAPEPPVAWQGLLGYLNFSTGKPDPRFQGQFHAACRLPEILSASDPLVALADRLEAELARLQREGACWGFPSANSDYDVRFIYVESLTEYLSISARRNVIEASRLMPPVTVPGA